MTGCAGYTLGRGANLLERLWGEGESDGTFDQEEGLADMSGSHRRVWEINGFCHTLNRVNTIRITHTHRHTHTLSLPSTNSVF